MTTRSQIACPREQSFMTPCISRDGSSALADDKVCVGCGWKPSAVAKDLATRWAPAGELYLGSPAQLADKLPGLITDYLASRQES